MLSSHLALPCKGHLQQVYHMFGYLKAQPKKTLAFDPTHPDIDEARFLCHDWHDFYRGAKELIPGTHRNQEVMSFQLTVLLMLITQVTGLRGDHKLGSCCFVIVPPSNGIVNVRTRWKLPHLGANLLRCVLLWS